MHLNFTFTHHDNPNKTTSKDALNRSTKMQLNSNVMLNTPDKQMGEKMQLLGKKAMRALTNKNILRLIGEGSAVSMNGKRSDSTANKL